MTEAIAIQPSTALTLNLQPVMELTDEQLYLLCQANRELRFERTAQGKLLLMAPTGGETGRRNSMLNQRLANWAERDGTGLTFDSSTGFALGNGAMRAPDAAWVKRSLWDALTPEQKQKFVPLCPDFVIELRSGTDTLRSLQDKLQEYIHNGASLGWLIDPQHRRVYVYRPNTPVDCLENVESVSGDPELPGWVLHLRDVWS